jgi:GDP-L-fucose synthase
LDLTIRKRTEVGAMARGSEGETQQHLIQPNDTPKKQINVSNLAALGWSARITLTEVLATTVVLFRGELERL